MKQREWVGEREKLQRMKEMEKETRKDKKRRERARREINKQTNKSELRAENNPQRTFKIQTNTI